MGRAVYYTPPGAIVGKKVVNGTAGKHLLVGADGMLDQADVETGVSIGDDVTDATSGSVLFIDSSGNLAQDNANFFWDDTNNRLGIGTASPQSPLDVRNASGDVVLQVSDTAMVFGKNLGGADPSFVQFHAPAGEDDIVNFRNKSGTTVLTLGTDSGGTARFRLQSNKIELNAHPSNASYFADTVAVGRTTTPSGNLEVGTTSATKIGVVVHGFASQSANLQNWQDSGGSVMSSISSLGKLYISNKAASGIGANVLADLYQADDGAVNDYGALRINGSRGTIASPDAIWPTRDIAGIIFSGYETFTPGYTPAIRLIATNLGGTWSALGEVDTALRVYAKLNNTESLSATFTSSGLVVGDGSQQAANLTIGRSGANSALEIFSNSGGSFGVGISADGTRWGVQSGNGSSISSDIFSVKSGQVGVGTGSSFPTTGRFTVRGGSSTAVVMYVGHTFGGQTADLFQGLDASGSGGSGTPLFRITASGGAVFNEQGLDADFRVEGDTDPNLFVIDASDDAVKIGEDGSSKVGFYGTTPTIQQVLATGAGATVDDVISALQTLGLVAQS